MRGLGQAEMQRRDNEEVEMREIDETCACLSLGVPEAARCVSAIWASLACDRVSLLSDGFGVTRGAVGWRGLSIRRICGWSIIRIVKEQ